MGFGRRLRLIGQLGLRQWNHSHLRFKRIALIVFQLGIYRHIQLLACCLDDTFSARHDTLLFKLGVEERLLWRVDFIHWCGGMVTLHRLYSVSVLFYFYTTPAYPLWGWWCGGWIDSDRSFVIRNVLPHLRC